MSSLEIKLMVLEREIADGQKPKTRDRRHWSGFHECSDAVFTNIFRSIGQQWRG